MIGSNDESAKTNRLDSSNEFKEQSSALAEQDNRILDAEVLRQEQDGHDTEPNFFQGIHQHSQISQPRPQQRHGRLRRLRLTMTRIPHSPVPSDISPPVATTTTFRTHLRHLFTRPPHHAMPLVVDVPFAKGKERNIAADAPGKDPDIVPYEDEDLDTTQQDRNTQEQQQPVAVQVDTGEHGGGRSYCCC
jgi:hypothetical protein